MRQLFRVAKKFFECKQEAKAERNRIEGYSSEYDKAGVIKPHNWKTTVKRGPDHWNGATK